MQFTCPFAGDAMLQRRSAKKKGPAFEKNFTTTIPPGDCTGNEGMYHIGICRYYFPNSVRTPSEPERLRIKLAIFPQPCHLADL